jgi:MoxR-like ATPase
MVAATQNPIEHEGTYPLPEAQLDRFMFYVNLVLPDIDHERRILDQVMLESEQDAGTGTPLPVSNAASILLARRAVRQVFIAEAVRDYIVRLVGAARVHRSTWHWRHALSPGFRIGIM